MELGNLVQARRKDMGLTQARLSELAELSRATVNQIERGSIQELSLGRTARLLAVLGYGLAIEPSLSSRARAPGSKSSPLVLASRSASVSYKNSLTPEALRDALVSGVVPPDLIPHMNSLLDDASTGLLAGVVEQVREESGVKPATLWANLKSLAQRFKSRRDLWQ